MMLYVYYIIKKYSLTWKYEIKREASEICLVSLSVYMYAGYSEIKVFSDTKQIRQVLSSKLKTQGVRYFLQSQNIIEIRNNDIIP